MTVTLMLCCLFCHFVWNARWNDYYIYDIREAANRCMIMADRLYVGCFFSFFFLFFPLRFNRRRRNNTNTSVLCKTTVTNCVQVPGWFEFTLHGKQLCLSKVQLLASELMIGAVKERKKKNPMWANNWQNLEASAFFYFLFLTVIIWTWLLTPSSLQS